MELKEHINRFKENEPRVDTFVNGDENTDVVTSSGATYPSQAKTVAIFLKANGFEPFQTEVLLLASIPTDPKHMAWTADTQKFWYWNGTAWLDTGLSQFQQGIVYSKPIAANFLKLLDPVLAYKDSVRLDDATPSSPLLNDTYIAGDSGTIFGRLCEIGQFLTYDGTRFGLKDTYQILEKLNITKTNIQMVAASQFLINGYITTSGAFVSSEAGYKTSYFKPVVAGDVLLRKIYASPTTNALSYYDVDFNYIGGVVGTANTFEQIAIVPTNAAYVRICTFPPNTASGSYLRKRVKTFIDDNALVSENDFTIQPSLNLAKPEFIVNDFYVNSSGTLTASAGWKHIKIPVAAGVQYTFGNFAIDSAGYYAFYNSSNALIAGSNSSFQTGMLPRTVTAPTGAAFFLIDIKRPINTEADYSNLIVNIGTSLVPYEPPIDYIVAIAGYSLAGATTGDYISQGDDAILGSVTANSITISVLISNLPSGTSQPSGLEINQTWLDTTDPNNGIVKVKLT